MSFEDDLDRDLDRLFKSTGPLEPSREFVDRTVLAASRAPLPEGRHVLTHRSHSLWWISAAAAGIVLTALVLAGTGTLFASAMATLFRGALRTSGWLAHGFELWLAFSSVSSTVGLAVARGMATAEGLSILVATSLTSALALSALHRLLSDEREKSQWQEL